MNKFKKEEGRKKDLARRQDHLSVYTVPKGLKSRTIGPLLEGERVLEELLHIGISKVKSYYRD